MSDEKLLQYDLLLGGKWVTSRDPLMLKEGDFSVLTNMRYTDTNPVSIGGMELTNTSGLNATDTITASYQFTKTQPDETHMLIQRKIWTTGSITDSDLEEITSPSIGGSPGAIATTNLYDDGVTIGALTDTAQFSPAPNNAVVYCNGDESLMWLGTRNTVGKFINASDDPEDVASFSYDYTETVNKDDSTAALLVEDTVASGGGEVVYMYIMTTAPVCGFYFDVVAANNTASTAAAYYWSNSSADWVAVSDFVDYTDTGASLAQDGYMTFTQPSHTPHVIGNVNGYWYKITISATNGTTSIGRVYAKYAVQKVHNLWDGADRACVSCLWVDGAVYYDKTASVSKIDYQEVGSNEYKHTFFNIGPATSADAIYFGFAERTSAICFILCSTGATATNNNAVTPTLKYWNGAAWTALGGVKDNTVDAATEGKFLFQSGLVSWCSPAASAEFKRSINNGPELYYYQLTLSASPDETRIDYIYGIPTYDDLDTYKTSTLWKNRLIFGNNLQQSGNELLIGSTNTNCVFNGADSVKLFIDDPNEIQKLATIPVKFANGVEDVLLIIKKDKTYTITGNTPEDFRYVKVSDQYGIISPSTFALCEYSDSQNDVYRPVAIWLSASGVVMYDAGVIRQIDGDIEDKFVNMFNTGYSTRISATYAYKASGWFDSLNGEYHLLYPEGTATTNNTEIVYDLSRQKWYKIDRGSLDLLYGAQFKDTNGMPIQYGFIPGKYYRLDYGTAFGTDAIVSQFTICDKPYTKSISSESVLRYIRLNGAAVTTTTGTPVITLTHYGDSKTTGTSLGTKSAAASGYRLYNNIWQTNKKANIHSLNFSFSNAYNLYHFQPLIVSVSYFGDRMEVRSS